MNITAPKNFSLSNAIILMAFAAVFPTQASSQDGKLKDLVIKRIEERKAGRTKPSPHDKIVSLKYGGRDRYYIVHVPPAYDPSKPVPMVLVIHGGGGDPAQIQQQVGFDELADRDNVLTVYPAGNSGAFKDMLLTWNTLLCDTYADKEKIDDVGFLRKVIDEVGSQYKVDPKRVYATGMSQGAMMSYRLAWQASDKITAIAPVSGSMISANAHPSSPVSVMMFNGLKDDFVRYDGSVGTKHVTVPHDSVPQTAEFWAKFNGLSLQAKEQVIVDSKSKSYGPGRDGVEVVLWTHQGGHQWPGHARRTSNAGPGVDDINATELIWAFFMNHSKGNDPAKPMPQTLR